MNGNEKLKRETSLIKKVFFKTDFIDLRIPLNNSLQKKHLIIDSLKDYRYFNKLKIDIINFNIQL